MLRSLVTAVFAVSTLGVPFQRLSREIHGSRAAEDKPIAIVQLAIDALADSRWFDFVTLVDEGSLNQFKRFMVALRHHEDSVFSSGPARIPLPEPAALDPSKQSPEALLANFLEARGEGVSLGKEWAQGAHILGSVSEGDSLVHVVCTSAWTGRVGPERGPQLITVRRRAGHWKIVLYEWVGST
jgi:hypothetical protein